MESENYTKETTDFLVYDLPNEAAISYVIENGCRMIRELCDMTKDENIFNFQKNKAMNVILNATAIAALEFAEVYNSEKRIFELCSQMGVYNPEEEKYYESEAVHAVFALLTRYKKEDQYKPLYMPNAEI